MFVAAEGGPLLIWYSFFPVKPARIRRRLKKSKAERNGFFLIRFFLSIDNNSFHGRPINPVMESRSQNHLTLPVHGMIVNI
jgi:hypothetical protein